MNTSLALRNKLLQLLENYEIRFPLEGLTLRRFRDFVRDNENLQGKTNLRGHVTASAWIINAERTKVLLTHHRKLGIWVQLGGHTDPGEDWQAAALREAREESGLQDLVLLQDGLYDVDIHEIPAHLETPAHFHYDLRFLYQGDDLIPLILSEESHDLAWVDIIHLGDLTREESQHRMAGKMRN